jgi:hypothetical protein
MKRTPGQIDQYEETIIDFFQNENMKGIQGQKLSAFPLSFYSGISSGQLRYEPKLADSSEKQLLASVEIRGAHNVAYDLTGRLPF